MNKNECDIEECGKDILDDFEKGEFISVENSEEVMELARQAARNFTKRNNPKNYKSD